MKQPKLTIEAKKELASIKKMDRKLTDVELRFMSRVMAYTNMGQELSLTIVENKLVIKEGTGKQAYVNLTQACTTMALLLNRSMKDDESINEIEAEVKSWVKDLKKMPMSEIARIWEDVRPVCAWMIANEAFSFLDCLTKE